MTCPSASPSRATGSASQPPGQFSIASQPPLPKAKGECHPCVQFLYILMLPQLNSDINKAPRITSYSTPPGPHRIQKSSHGVAQVSAPSALLPTRWWLRTSYVPFLSVFQQTACEGSVRQTQQSSVLHNKSGTEGRVSS
jgi:hypothetical protein